jgi:hypothetical protein
MSYVLTFAPAWRAFRTLSFLLLAVAAGAARADDPPPDPAASTEASAPPDVPPPFSLSQWGVNLSGFLRSDTAFSTSGKEDPFNQRGNLYNGVPVQRVSPLFTDTATRTGIPAHNTINLQQFRAEATGEWHISDSLTATARVRSVFDGGWYDAFDPNAVNSHAAGRVYGKPDYFRYDVQGASHPNPLEWSGSNYLVYFPSLFLDYNNGPVDIRAGMQQIAWGQAIFFRVLDVPDGLDLRRHSALDYASEEFSDKRTPAPAIRMTYQFSSAILGEAYVQKFQPTVYSNPNTPYNAISSQFTVHDHYADVDSKVDYGMRLKGNFGDIGVQAIAVRRYNPDGIYRWTESGVNRDLPAVPGSGAVLQHTPFEADPTGVWSSKEWFDYAGMARLNGVEGLNSAITDFPASAMLGAVAVPGDPNTPTSFAIASEELNEFFQLSGSGLRGHIERDYKAETDLGAGGSYVISGAPGSLLDQLIVNVEALYVPDRTFTAPGLGKDFVRTHEWTTALVLEKYQRFSASLPATYMVFQWLHKSESDLFGRYLGGYGGDANHAAPGVGGGYDALAVAFQQPFANLVWRADLAILADLRGGVLLQPAVRWKPSGQFTVEAFYNFVDGHLGGNPNDNALSTFDYADEAALRLSWQF